MFILWIDIISNEIHFYIEIILRNLRLNIIDSNLTEMHLDVSLLSIRKLFQIKHWGIIYD